jgi:sugar phosphate isomerase/epimerase
MRPVGVSAWIYGDAPLDATLARIAAAGYDAVELPGEPDAWRPEEARRLLARHGLTPVALTASCAFPATRRDLAHPDPGIRADAVAYLVGCLRWAAEVGVPLVQMLASGETRLAPVATEAEEWRWSVDAMQRAAREAERAGVRVAVEPLNRYEAYLVTTVAQALRYLDGIGSPWVGLTIDLFHANIEEPDLPGSIAAAGSRLWHVQLADTNRQGLGRGHLDLPACLAALDRADYTGALVLEVMAPGPDPFRAVKDARSPELVDAFLRESLARLRALGVAR